MKIETIIECVNKLSTNYDLVINEKLKDDRIKLLFDAFKHKLDSSLKTATESVLKDENITRFPTVTQLENHMPIPHRQVQEFCDKCERAGYYNIWQLRESIGNWYSFAYRCPCNYTTIQNMPVLDEKAVPKRAHNPYPPNDKRYEDFNERFNGVFRNA